MPLKRIQKILSEKGICSRREGERFIQNGWIKVNGKRITDCSTKIDEDKDVITISDEVKKMQRTKTYIVFYKPRGIVTHSPQIDEKEIKDYLPKDLWHCKPIGRLDKESEGLMICSDDGVFTKHCLQQENAHKRIYKIRVSKPLTSEMIRKCENGMVLFGQKTRQCKIKKMNEFVYELEMYEGKNRQIRRMIQKVGSMVTFLQRIQFANIKINHLKPGEYKQIMLSDVF